MKKVQLKKVVEKERKTAGEIVQKCFSVLNDEERLQKATPAQLMDLVQELVGMYEGGGTDDGQTGVVLLPQVEQ